MSLFSQIRARFFNAGPVSDSCELKDLYANKNAKNAKAPEPRAQHCASAKFSLTSLLDRIALSLPGFLRGPRAETAFSAKVAATPVSANASEKSFASTVSQTLDELAAASKNKNSEQIIASLTTLHQLDLANPGKLDDALNAHLVKKGTHKSGRSNPVQAMPHMILLIEANPVKIQETPAPRSDETLNQFHADLMRRIEEQYGAVFRQK